MIENLKKFERTKMEKNCKFHVFKKNQLFRFLIISLVIFNLQEHTIHQNKAEDILSRPNFLTFIATINV